MSPRLVQLQIGEHFFGGAGVRVRTVLGSCVSLTCWHPGKRLGGICHYMLPAPVRRLGRRGELDGRYAEDAMTLLLNEIGRAGLASRSFQYKLFGGADMFDAGQVIRIGQQNIEAAHRFLARHGLHCMAEHLGGVGHRELIFDTGSGVVLLKQIKPSINDRSRR